MKGQLGHSAEEEPRDDDLMFRLGESLIPLSWDGGYDGLNHHQRVFVCVWELDATVQEGGFSQYFIDACGDHSADAVEALREIGAMRMAKLMERARRVFPGGRPPATQEERDTLLLEETETLEPKLERFTEDYLAYPEDVTDLVSAYVAFMRAEFPEPEVGCGVEPEPDETVDDLTAEDANSDGESEPAS